jgi:hypothetical protein
MPIIENMPESEYRSHSAIANSDLVTFRRSAAHFEARRRFGSKDTPAKLDGRALHCAILEPETFLQRYCVLPADAPRDLRHLRDAKQPSASTKEAIAWWDAWEAESAGRITLDAADYTLKMETASRIRQHPALRTYFEAPGQFELSVFATDPETGVEVKCRIDRLVTIAQYRVGLDPKSTDDARYDAFQSSAYKFGYFQQNAFYRDVCEWAGIPLDLFLFIAFEKEEPFGVKVYEMSEDDLEYGRRLYRPALNAYAQCLESGEFPSYDDSIEVLTRPAWAKE